MASYLEAGIDFLDPLELKNIERGSYMSAHVSMNLLNELRKSDKMRGLQQV